MRAPTSAIARAQEHHHRSDATTVTPSAKRYLSAPSGHIDVLGRYGPPSGMTSGCELLPKMSQRRPSQ
eukprot:s1061_g4.t1